VVIFFCDSLHAQEASVPSSQSPGCCVWQYLRHTSWTWAVPGETLALRPVIVKHPCTTRLQADLMFSVNGRQSSVIIQPARLHTEPALRWAWAKVDEDTGDEECSKHSQCEILMCFEEFQMEIISRMIYLQAVCCCHAWTGSSPWSLNMTCYGWSGHHFGENI
jgi:hypothetical protein